MRARYWARSAVGWARVSGAEPNATHQGLSRLEEAGLVVGVITQNVDGLHQRAGSRRVIELHGSLDDVICLGCGDRTTRAAVQTRMLERNAAWMERIGAAGGAGGHEPAPDGDAEVPSRAYAEFETPGCVRCGGVLKPDVVFFGENVPRERVSACWRLLDEADCLLVVGTSLTVYSGRRFVYGAVEREMPVGVVNLGPTRADDVAAAKVEGRTGHVIPLLAEALGRN